MDGLGSLEWFMESLWVSLSPFVNNLEGIIIDIHTSDFPHLDPESFMLKLSFLCV